MLFGLEYYLHNPRYQRYQRGVRSPPILQKPMRLPRWSRKTMTDGPRFTIKTHPHHGERGGRQLRRLKISPTLDHGGLIVKFTMIELLREQRSQPRKAYLTEKVWHHEWFGEGGSTLPLVPAGYSRRCKYYMQNQPCRHRRGCRFSYGIDELAPIGTRYGQAELDGPEQHRPRFANGRKVKWRKHFWGQSTDGEAYCILGRLCDRWHSFQQPTDFMDECTQHIDYENYCFVESAPFPPLIENRGAMIQTIIAEAEEDYLATGGQDPWHGGSMGRAATPLL